MEKAFSLCEQLKIELKEYDLIDLLEKLSCLRFLILTNSIKCIEEERRKYRTLFDKAFCFLFPFLLCYKVEQGSKKINYDELNNICEKIFEISLDNKFSNQLNDEDYFTKIDYVQNNLTDLIAGCKKIPVGDLLKFENDLLENKYNVDNETLLKELIEIFPQKIYSPIDQKQHTIEDFINNFNLYIDVNNFILKDNSKSYKICLDLSIEFGALSETQFDISNPLSTVNLTRKIFIKNDGIIYNICDDLICSRLIRSIESLFNTTCENNQWAINYKEGTETLVGEMFDQYLPGGKNYKNLFYRDANGRLCENDVLFKFYNFVFCIEIKGSKFNPDPIAKNYKKVKESYDLVIEKVQNQVIRIKEQINKQIAFNILDCKGKTVEKLFNSRQTKVIGICVYFEDIGTLLSGLPSNCEKVLHVSFYDLVIIFNYLNNPFLITKYLLERSEIINNENIFINDEMVYLDLFSQNVQLSYIFNNNKLITDTNVKKYFTFNDEIEKCFYENIPKAKLNISKLLIRILTMENYLDLDEDLFDGLFGLLNVPNEKLEKLEAKYAINNRKNIRLPIAFTISDKESKEYSILIISRDHNPTQKLQNIAFVKKYFDHKNSITHAYLILVGEEYSKCMKFTRDSDVFKSIDENKILSDMNCFIKQSDDLN